MGNKANHAQPIYQTVYNDLASRIIRKKLNSLSSIVIARDYGINRNTADKIIRLLETNGLVYRIPRKGTFPIQDTARKVDSINIIYGFNEFTDQFLNSDPYINAKLIEAVFRAPAASQCNVNLLFIDPAWSEETIREKFVSLGRVPDL